MRRVFVTGGSRGIGAAIVRELAALPDHRIVFTYKSQHELAAQVIAATGRPDAVRAVPMDLARPESIAAAVRTALDWESGYDIVVHNAAMTADAPFFLLDEGAWQDVIQVSLNSFFYLNKAFIPTMLENRWGRIIVLGSVSGEAGQRGQSNYAAAKGAVTAAAKSLAREMARKGILTNVVSPGLIETDMTAGVDPKLMLPLIPAGRFGRPDEVAKVVRFLASDDSSYVNGTVLQVNGGLYT